LGIDVEHLGIAVETLHGTHSDAVGESAAFAVSGDDECHSLPISEVTCARQRLPPRRAACRQLLPARLSSAPPGARIASSTGELEEGTDIARALANDLGIRAGQIHDGRWDRASGTGVEHQSETEKVVVDLGRVEVRSRAVASRR